MAKRTLQECYHQGKGNLAIPGTFKINHRFNRLEYIDHAYRCHHGTEPIGDSFYQGMIKCKLIYTEEFELIIPDLIFIKFRKNQFRWFQFHHFIPGTFALDDNNRFHVAIDISGGHRLIVSFSPKEFVKKLSDNSNLYNCRIRGPKKIREFSTGEGKLIDGIPYIYLYHHTSKENKTSILKSKELWGSPWNYQGNKKIKNLEFCYFTSLDRIKMPLDWKMIAMAQNERILAIVDKTLEKIPIKLNREPTENRNSTIEFLIDTSLLANDHINERKYDEPNNSNYFYEMMFPYIYRVGIELGSHIKFNKDHIVKKSKDNVSPNYIVLGKGYDRNAITAAYNEEETEFIGKIYPLANEDSDDAITTNIKFLHKRQEIHKNLEVKYLKFD